MTALRGLSCEDSSPTHTKTKFSSFTPVQTGLLQRKCNSCDRHTIAGGECSECQNKRLSLQRRSSQQAEPDEAPQIVHEVLHSPGQPLDATTRAFMKSRLGYDFSQVRVHTDAKAAESAKAVNALAYTVGRDVVFGSGQYAPRAATGRLLLSHELIHVKQQRHLGDLQPEQNLHIASDRDTFEQEAQAQAMAAGQAARPIPHNPQTSVLQRVGLGESITRFFGGGTFSEQELQDYLRFLDREHRIEDRYDSDNKAREIVKHWKRGDSLYILPIQRKILLVEEMLSGFTGDDDEQAILDLLRGSTDTELSAILASVGQQTLESNFHGEERRQLDRLLTARQSARPGTGRQGQGASSAASSEVFSGETVLELQQRFKSNAESSARLNCILIIRELAPQLFAQDPQLAQTVAAELGKLTGRQLKMTEVGRVMSDLGLASHSAKIRFNNGNGQREPTAMEGSAWDTIMGMVGNTYGWHIFGLAVFDGYHSVTVLVDNRPDGARLYWADQWRIDPGDDFDQEPGSVSGFRRYEKTGFDNFIAEYTRSRWNSVLQDKNRRYATTLHIWKFRSRLSTASSP